jgi:hypothetical protein
MSSRIIGDTLTWLMLLAKEPYLVCVFVLIAKPKSEAFRAWACQVMNRELCNV